MKKLLIPILILLATATYGQVADTVNAISKNPVLLSKLKAGETNDTAITRVNLPRKNFDYVVILKFPSGNSGTVQVNSEGDVVSGSPLYAAGTTLIFTCTGRFFIKCSDASDDVEISY